MKKKAELRAVMLHDGADGIRVRTDCAAGREDMLILLSLLLDDAAQMLDMSPAQALEALGEAHRTVLANREYTVDLGTLTQTLKQEFGQRE